jgi:hypothetical protein
MEWLPSRKWTDLMPASCCKHLATYEPIESEAKSVSSYNTIG